ncbi:hypothetical protein [Rahnella victoriana]|uniref:hypothetical protein n=1 Tax=Rahnella victoriana TaxID=1510570 RepID=UPI001E63D2C7|nr:hypothetical protein [Rahnella victoriana]UHM93636.1 hypothetical protein J9880_24610 [Rahnella victoriana]
MKLLTNAEEFRHWLNENFNPEGFSDADMQFLYEELLPWIFPCFVFYPTIAGEKSYEPAFISEALFLEMERLYAASGIKADLPHLNYGYTADERIGSL